MKNSKAFIQNTQSSLRTFWREHKTAVQNFPFTAS